LGRKAELRKRFFDKHPLCCFCGGSVRATEVDHIPSRSLFSDRQWPEGYEFPACAQCNDASRWDEEVVAFLSRAYPDPSTDSELKQYKRILDSLAKHRPDILYEMKPSARQVRRELVQRDMKLPPGFTTADVPILSVTGEKLNSAVLNFGRKLCLALYYKHAEQVLPPNGGIAIRWYSNLQIHSDEIPRELGPAVPGFPKLVRNSGDLSDQFFYRWGVSHNKHSSCFLAFFRRSFAILGFASSQRSDLGTGPLMKILTPYSHNENVNTHPRSEQVNNSGHQEAS
jgi:hypothetical protein